MLGLIAGALGVGRALYGLTQNRHEGNRRRNLIYQAYGRGKQRMDLTQGDQRQSSAEGLVARGLAQGGDVTNGTAATPGGGLSVSGAHTLAGQQMTDLGREQTLEQNEMLAQRDAAIQGVNADQRQGAVDAVTSGISTGLSVYGAGKDLGAMRSGGATGASAIPAGTPSATGTPIFNAMGVSNPANWFAGVNGLDPLRAPGSSWNTGGGGSDVAIGEGQPNYAFNRRTG